MIRHSLAIAGMSISLLFTAPIQASSFYVRGQLGHDWLADNAPLSKTPRSITGRLSAGYNFGHLGFEVGASFPRLFMLQVGKGVVNTEASLTVFDALARLQHAFGRLYIYGAAGGAFIHETDSPRSTTTYTVRPKFAAGIGYLLNPHLSIDLEYSRILTTQNYSPKINTAALGGLTLSL
jgi:hypothetical protein